VTLAELERHGRAVETVAADRQIIGYAVALADATRHPGSTGCVRWSR